MGNSNRNHGNNSPKMETQTVEMDIKTSQSTETVEQMEIRIRKEMQDKHDLDFKAQEERIAKIESGMNKNSEAPIKSYSPTDVQNLLESMIAEKNALVEKLKGEKEDMVIDDTVSRAMNSTFISKNLKGKFNPRKGVANFMMRQNTRYAIEGKPEPYTVEALENTLKREMGVS